MLAADFQTRHRLGVVRVRGHGATRGAARLIRSLAAAGPRKLTRVRHFAC